jgi:predicted nucleic acid-binding protein
VILLDTGPLVALCDPRDRLNGLALRDLDRFARRPLVVCDPVLTEASFHLPHPVQRERLRRFLTDFAVQPHQATDPLAYRAAVLEWLLRYGDQEPDWADGHLVVAASHERRARVWTYDREFTTTWRRLDGTRVPLARAD